jgi:hypothetical protein
MPSSFRAVLISNQIRTINAIEHTSACQSTPALNTKELMRRPMLHNMQICLKCCISKAFWHFFENIKNTQPQKWLDTTKGSLSTKKASGFRAHRY